MSAEAFQALAEQRIQKKEANHWLTHLQKEALNAFSSTGFPTTKNEDWKYTDLKSLRSKDYLSAPHESLTSEDIAPYLIADLDCHKMIFVNGLYQAQLSDIQAQQNITITHLKAAFKEKPCCQFDKDNRHAFYALNTALLSDGVNVDIGKNTSTKLPIFCLYITTASSQNTFTMPRTMINAQSGAEATIIEKYVSHGKHHHFTNAYTEINIDSNAHISHYQCQEENQQSYQITQLVVKQQQDSSFYSYAVNIGGRLSRHDIHCQLLGKHANCYLNGLYLGIQRQHIDYHTRVDHIAAHCGSYEYYKGVLGGHSRAVFNGQVHVHKDAQKSDAVQSNANLLLSNHAEIDTKPQLEIYADDVKCAHGATVGQLDENMLFYLRSRGLSERTAKTILTYGFACDIIAKMQLQPLKKYFENYLIQHYS